MSRLLQDREIRKEARNRGSRKRNIGFVETLGRDFVGLNDILDQVDTLEEKWELFSRQKCIRSNVCVFEYAETARALGEAALASFTMKERTVAERRISKATTKVIERLEELWFFGVQTETVDLELEYMIWVSLVCVFGVRNYRLAFSERQIPKVLKKRGILFTNKRYDQWFLSDLVMSMNQLVSQWPTLVHDGVLDRHVQNIRITYSQMQNNVFGAGTAVLDYLGYAEDVETSLGPGNTISNVLDKDMCAYFRDMQKDIELRIKFRGFLYEIEDMPSLDKEQHEKIAGWMNLRSHTQDGSAANTVLQRLRLSYFWYFQRPGSSARYADKAVENIGETVARAKDMSLDAKLSQCELEFGYLYPVESGAFTNEYFECDTDFVISMRNQEGHGKRAYELLILLAFSHTFDMHTGYHWFNTFFFNKPDPEMFRQREEKDRILFVRYGSEYYVVHTETMKTLACPDIATGLYFWIEHFLPLVTSELSRNRIIDLRDQMFESGQYELMAIQRQRNYYSGNSIIPPDIVANICHKL